MKLKTTLQQRDNLLRQAEQELKKYPDRIFARYQCDICDDFATLEAELASARTALHEIGAFGNALAREYFNAHPEPEGEGK